MTNKNLSRDTVEKITYELQTLNERLGKVIEVEKKKAPKEAIAVTLQAQSHLLAAIAQLYPMETHE
jgi:ElaB/YqjD/DUF883 family membrane-anchored ribosome-binding protein